MTIQEKNELKKTIKQLVKESLEFESSNKEKNVKKRRKDSVSKSKRAVVIKWLQDDAVNCAQIMRELWRPKDQAEEDAKRSYFYKCRDGELNDAGEPYRFTDEDITSLYKIKSNSQI